MWHMIMEDLEYSSYIGYLLSLIDDHTIDTSDIGTDTVQIFSLKQSSLRNDISIIVFI